MLLMSLENISHLKNKSYEYLQRLNQANGPAYTMDGDTNNCAVLALSAAFEIPYDEANSFALKNWRRVKRKGVSMNALIRSLCEKELFGRKIIEKSNKNKYVYMNIIKIIQPVLLV